MLPKNLGLMDEGTPTSDSTAHLEEGELRIVTPLGVMTLRVLTDSEKFEAETDSPVLTLVTSGMVASEKDSDGKIHFFWGR